MTQKLLIALAILLTTGSAGATSARPVLVVVQDDRAVANALTAELKRALARPGHKVVDARPLWNHLVFGQAPINQGELDTPIPPLWPSELRATWEEARDYCVRKANPPPFGITNQRAYLCGLKIAPYLWQKWLEHTNAEHLVNVRVFRVNPHDANDQRWNVEVAAFVPSSVDYVHLFRGELSATEVNSAAVELATQGLNGEGRVIRRTVDRFLPNSPHYHERPLPVLPNNGIPIKRHS
jgi:hypothetical protein